MYNVHCTMYTVQHCHIKPTCYRVVCDYVGSSHAPVPSILFSHWASDWYMVSLLTLHISQIPYL